MNTYLETRVISLNSEDAITYYNGSLLSHVLFSLPNLLKDDADILHRQLTIQNAQIPVSFYIINYTNNVLIWNNNISDFTITIPVGNYNSSSLITTLQSLIFTACAQTVVITINKITGILTFSSTTNFIIKASNPLTTSRLIFGFLNVNLNSTLISGNYIVNCPHPLNLLGIKQLQIRSSIISCNNYSTNNGSGQSNILSTVPVDSGAWGMINYNDTSSNKVSIHNTTLDDIDILITDAETGFFINFSNTNWTMTIILNLIKKIDISLEKSVFSSIGEKMGVLKPIQENQENLAALQKDS